MTRLKIATDADFWRFYGQEPPSRWLGVVGERRGALIGFGAVLWDDQGRAWGFFERRARVSAVTMHRAAVRTLAALRESGEAAVHTLCDRAVPDAEKWLARLGFKPDADLSNEKREVWTWHP